MNTPHTHHRTLFIAASLLLATLASTPRAQSHDGSYATVAREVHHLKVAFQLCERAAAEGLLGLGDAANCSITYEKLLKVGFGGDYMRLLAWWHAEGASETRGGRIATH